MTGVVELWPLFWWFCKWAFWRKRLRHWSHWNGLSPVCIIMCFFMYLTTLEHTGQVFETSDTLQTTFKENKVSVTLLNIDGYFDFSTVHFSIFRLFDLSVNRFWFFWFFDFFTYLSIDFYTVIFLTFPFFKFRFFDFPVFRYLNF